MTSRTSFWTTRFEPFRLAFEHSHVWSAKLLPTTSKLLASSICKLTEPYYRTMYEQIVTT